jgi:SAM-dependent methyltransferase
MREIFHGGLAVEWYDRMYAGKLPGTSVAGDVDFYLAAARRARGPVLELGSGTGRIALPLGRAGIQLTGLDVSSAMIRIARRKAEALFPMIPVRFVRGDMTRFNLGRKYSLTLIPFRAFQHVLDPERQRACLTCVHRHLKPGGRLIVDLFDPRMAALDPDRPRLIWRRQTVKDPLTGRTMTIVCASRNLDPIAQVMREIWEFTLTDRRGRVLRRQRDAITLRWTYRWEMRYLLELCGFRVVACYGDFKGGPPRYGREQVWVAERR